MLFGLEEVVRKLLEAEDVQVDAVTSIGTTALMEASSLGYIEVMKLLLGKGADPKKMNWFGTSLHCAAESGQCEAINTLLQTNIDIDIEDSHGGTALDCALQQGHLPAIELLKMKGAFRCRIYDRRPRIKLSLSNNHTDSLDFEIGSRKSRGTRNALHFALDEDDLELARLLLANGAAVDDRGEDGLRPLHWAAACGKIEAARLLLEAGAKVHLRCNEHTAYWYAAVRGHRDLQKLLMSFGATVCPNPSQQEADGLNIGLLAVWRLYD